MKKILFLLPVVAFFGCNPPKSGDSTSRWEITSQEAHRMVRYLQDCRENCGEQLSIGDSNDDALREIREFFNEAGDRLVWMDARYTEEDERRYREVRGMDDQVEDGDVGGYRTQLLAGTKANSMVTFYYDILRLCPPPRTCGAGNLSTGSQPQQNILTSDELTGPGEQQGE